MRRAIYGLAFILVVSGCSRPQAVRNVASASQPIVVGLQQSAPELQQRFQLQREAFAARAAEAARLNAAAKASTAAVDRTWRFLGNDRGLKQLAVLRERDDQIRADPLAPLKGPAMPTTAKADEIDLSSLKKTVSALDRLKGAERMDWTEVLLFAKAVNDELAKLEEEAAAAPAAGSGDNP